MGFQVYNSQGQELQNLTGTAGGDLTGTYPNPTIANQDACKAVRRSTQSVTSGSNNFASFTAEDYDTNSMFAPTDTKITIKTAGLYSVVGTGFFAFNSSGRRSIIIEKNAASAGGGTTLQRDIGPPTGDDVRILTVSWVGNLALNDTVHLTLYQNSGSTINVGSTEQDSLSLAVVRLRGTA